MSKTDDPEPTPRLPETQEGIRPDADDRVVVIRGVNSSSGDFHALKETDDGYEPACPAKRRKGRYDDWDLGMAMVWRDPCWNCFDPDAVPESDQEDSQ